MAEPWYDRLLFYNSSNLNKFLYYTGLVFGILLLALFLIYQWISYTVYDAQKNPSIPFINRYFNLRTRIWGLVFLVAFSILIILLI